MVEKSTLVKFFLRTCMYDYTLILESHNQIYFWIRSMVNQHRTRPKSLSPFLPCWIANMINLVCTHRVSLGKDSDD